MAGGVRHENACTAGQDTCIYSVVSGACKFRCDYELLKKWASHILNEEGTCGTDPVIMSHLDSRSLSYKQMSDEPKQRDADFNQQL